MTLKERIERALKKHPDGISCKDLSVKLKARDGDVGQALGQMTAAGVVECRFVARQDWWSNAGASDMLLYQLRGAEG